MKNTYISLLNELQELGGEEEFDLQINEAKPKSKKLFECRRKIKDIELKLTAKELIAYNKAYVNQANNKENE